MPHPIQDLSPGPFYSILFLSLLCALALSPPCIPLTCSVTMTRLPRAPWPQPCPATPDFAQTVAPLPFATAFAPLSVLTSGCSHNLPPCLALQRLAFLPLARPSADPTSPSVSRACPRPSHPYPTHGSGLASGFGRRPLVLPPPWSETRDPNRPRPRPVCPASAAAAGGELPAACAAGSEKPGAEHRAHRVPRVLLSAGARRGRGAARVSAHLLQVRPPPRPTPSRRALIPAADGPRLEVGGARALTSR